jgi:hypothetical protein
VVVCPRASSGREARRDRCGGKGSSFRRHGEDALGDQGGAAQFETSTLADLERTLSEFAESLAQTTSELAAIRWEEWVDAEGARLHLKRTKKQFERIAPQLPRHYISEHGILYNVRELDEWLMDR